MRRTLGLLSLAALFILVAAPRASADGLTWTLTGVTFSDGGTASGSFDYDALTNTVSSVDITTTLGSSFGGATYAAVDPGFGPSPSLIVFVTLPSLADYTGTPVLALDFGGFLTDLGGTVPVEDAEFTCGDPGCTLPGSTLRLINAGTVTTVSTPEPSSLLLFGSGLLGLVSAARRKIRLS